MANLKDIELDDILIDKYGNEFKVHQFITNHGKKKIIVKQVKSVKNSPTLYMPSYKVGSNDVELMEVSKDSSFNSFGILTIPKDRMAILGYFEKPGDNCKYIPCYSEMDVKKNQGVLDVLDDLFERINLKGNEKERFLNRLERVDKTPDERFDEEFLALYLTKKIKDMQ